MTKIQQSSPDYSESTRQNLAPTSHHQDWSLKIFFVRSVIFNLAHNYCQAAAFEGLEKIDKQYRVQNAARATVHAQAYSLVAVSYFILGHPVLSMCLLPITF